MPNCPACHQRDVTTTQYGYRCNQCNHTWPFFDCCEPDYDYERGRYVHAEDCETERE